MLVLGALGFRDRKETDVLQLICSVSLIAKRRILEDEDDDEHEDEFLKFGIYFEEKARIKVLRGKDIGSSLNGPRAEAADELFLEQEKNRHHGHRHQEGSGHRTSPVDSEHGTLLP